MRPLAWRPEMRCTAASLSRRANYLNRVDSAVRFPYFDRQEPPDNLSRRTGSPGHCARLLSAQDTWLVRRAVHP
jgi:hypothetical protein